MRQGLGAASCDMLKSLYAKKDEQKNPMSAATAESKTYEFQAEVSRLLDIVANALYSNKEIFLRELISNASDACDKLRYRALTEDGLMASNQELSVVLEPDAEAGKLVITDTGIGMNAEDLQDTLGAIGRSGTAKFMEALENSADSNLIGQFGVGFYSAFMVADTVTVETRKAGEDQSWRWQSDGKGAYTIEPMEQGPVGTRIILDLKDDAKDFADRHRLEHLVKKYSDHIVIPVQMPAKAEDVGEEGGEEGGGEGGEGAISDTWLETLNKASALWTKSKSDISKDEYDGFYKSSAGAWDDPWETLHFNVEGHLEHTGLLFIPSARPFNLFEPDRKNAIKLYVKRVFITDDCQELAPAYLRFLRGVIDSSDLPLNVSRELLQASPILNLIRKDVTKRTLSALKSRAKKDAEGYSSFWSTFGAVVKEGLYEDPDQRDPLLELARFKSSTQDGWVSLADYKDRMVEGQTAIYYLVGESQDAVKRSPHLEGFKAKGVEVLLLSDPVDSFWTSVLGDYQGTPLKSVTRGADDLASIKKVGDSAEDAAQEPVKEGDFAELIAAMKESLGDDVKDVRLSERLTDSAVCLVADEGDMDMQFARIMAAHGQEIPKQARILEINPKHDAIQALKSRPAHLEDSVQLLLDQALILEGEAPRDASLFAQRLSRLMA